MMSQGRCIYFLTTRLANYPGSIPLSGIWSLPCSSALVRLSSLMSPDEPWRKYHSLGLIQVCLQDEPLRHSYHSFQRFLYPDCISPCYPSVICVEADFVFPHRPPKTMLILLGSTDLLKGSPDYCIHYDIKQFQVYRVSLNHLSPRAEGSPVILPDFETTLFLSQYRCSN